MNPKSRTGSHDAGHRAVGLESMDGLLDYIENPSRSADMVILDLRLDGHGIDMARRLRRLAPAVPIAVLSGSVGDAAAARELATIGIGGNGLVTLTRHSRPFSSSRAIASVSRTGP